MVKIVRSQIICYSNYLVISEIIKVLEKLNHINSIKVMKDSIVGYRALPELQIHIQHNQLVNLCKLQVVEWCQVEQVQGVLHGRDHYKIVVSR